MKKYVQSRSMFRRFFFLIFGFVIAVIMLFFGVSYSLLEKSYKAKAEMAAQDILQKSSRILDMSFDQTERALTRLASLENMIGAAVAPNHNLKDRSVAIMSELQALAKSSDAVEQAILYISYDGIMFTSDMEEREVGEDSPIGALMAAYRAAYPENDAQAKLFEYEGTACVIRDTPGGMKRSLSTLILIIDKEKLYELVRDTEDNGTILVFRDGDLFLYDKEIDETGETFSEEASRVRSEAAYSSEQSGLTFLYVKTGRKPAAESVVANMLLVGVVVLLALFALVYATAAAQFALRPVHSLVESVLHRDGEDEREENPETENTGSHKNEIEYLQSLFDQIRSENRSLVTAASIILPEAERRLLADLIRKPDSAGHVEEYLRSINSSLAGRKHFHAALMDVDLKSAGSAAEKEQELVSLVEAMRNRIAGWKEKQYILRFVQADERTILVMAAETGRTVLADPAGDMEELLHILLGVTSSKGINVKTWISPVMYGLQQVPVMYQTGKKQLALNEKQGSEKVTEVNAGKNEVRLQAEELTGLLMDGKVDQALDMSRRMSEDLAARGLDRDELAALRGRYEEELQRRLMSMGLISEKRHQSYEGSTQIERFGSMLRAYVEAVSAFLEKKSSRQILAALRYIDQHSDNGLLSLNDVAEAIGIHPSYLSSIFSGVTGMRFSEYVNRVRVEEAKGLLRQSGMTVREISEQCGFNSVQSFNRVFKQYENLTPGEYRKKKE